MDRQIYPQYPPRLSDEQLDFLITTIQDWSIAHGLAVRPSPTWIPQEQDPRTSLASTAPVTLFPSLFPRSCFHAARGIQQAYNELYAAIASDEKWLQQVVEELVRVDDFIADLWRIHLAVKDEGYVQDLALGMFRSDYMVHLDPLDSRASPTIKQVEFNTIASSFGGLSSQVSKLHAFLSKIGAHPEQETKAIISNSALSESSSASQLAQGLAQAHQAYGVGKSSLPTCVIFLVQESERNVFDQRHLEYQLTDTHGIPIFRLPFSKVQQFTKVDANRNLIYRPLQATHSTFEVSVVYFRAGYAPTDYTSKIDWDSRLLIERSRAIKCPTVLTQLAGTKKVQQVLATPKSPHLARFISDHAVAERISETFAPIYPLDKSEAGLEARKLAQNPDTAVRYVLKPQREGGGNNVYRKAIPDFLKGLRETHWPAHILMEMIEPPALTNTILRNGEIQTGGVITELGVYGVCLWRAKMNGKDHAGVAGYLQNNEAGYLLRTKGDQSEEGGVAAGFGAVDSVCLVDV